MTIELVPLATVTVTLADPFILEHPVGHRVIAEVVGLVAEGDRLHGRLKGRAAVD